MKPYYKYNELVTCLTMSLAVLDREINLDIDIVGSHVNNTTVVGY